MNYLVSSFVIILFIVYFEYKLKYKKSDSLIDSFKNNFSLIKMIFISSFFSTLMILFSVILEKVNVFEELRSVWSIKYLPYIIYTVIAVPFIEEYVYRFLPYKLLGFGSYKIIALISSLAFMFFHNGGVSNYIFIFLMALFLSFIYIKTKNISYIIGCHGMYNLLAHSRYFGLLSNIFIFVFLFIFSGLVLIYLRVKELKVKM